MSDPDALVFKPFHLLRLTQSKHYNSARARKGPHHRPWPCPPRNPATCPRLPSLFLSYAGQLLSRGLYTGCSQCPEHWVRRPHGSLPRPVYFFAQMFSWRNIPCPCETAIPHTSLSPATQSLLCFHHSTYQPAYSFYTFNLHILSFIY